MIQGLLHIDHIVALPIPSFELLKPPSRDFEESLFEMILTDVVVLLFKGFRV